MSNDGRGDASLFQLCPFLHHKHSKAIKLTCNKARLLNHLVATSLIEEAGPDLFYANAHTRHFATDAVQDGFEY